MICHMPKFLLVNCSGNAPVSSEIIRKNYEQPTLKILC